MSLRSFFALLATAATGSCFAQGGPPMITDDPGTPPVGRFELNFAYTVTRHFGSLEVGLPLIDLAFGATPNLQLKVEAPWLLVNDGGSSARNLGPGNIGIKWRFQDETPGMPAISIFPQVEAPVSQRSVDDGLADPATGFLLPVEVQWHSGRLGFNADAGVFARSGSSPDWFAGLATSRGVGPNDEAIAEVHVEGSTGERNLDCIAQLGWRHGLSEDSTLIVAVGRSLFTQRLPMTRFNGYFGIQLRF
ncbi:MAG: hypothetical protein JNM28_13210 [Armatimonadetes bacterium]|nr:hypothetical protein [Armatimonadota bacterium]